MAAGHPAPIWVAIRRARMWTVRHDTALLIASASVLVFLFFIYALGAQNMPIPTGVVSIVVICLILFFFVSTALKGLVPAIICGLGVVLLHNAIFIQYYPANEAVQPHLLLNERRGDIVEESADVAITLIFLLGIAAVAMSMIVAHMPRLMFTRNRPEENDSDWSKYPIWHDNVRFAGRFSEPLVAVKSLMEDRDRYILWRYEYVLTNIYGAPHLVKPDGLVPEKSTEFMRDRDSGILMGIGKYNGYFV